MCYRSFGGAKHHCAIRMFTTPASRVLQLERELVSAKADLIGSKTLRTTLGSKVTNWVTAMASFVVLLAMTITTFVTALVGSVELVSEIIITLATWIEFALVSIVMMCEVLFVACATLGAIVSTLLDPKPKVDTKRVLFDLPPPPPSPELSPPPSPPDSPSHTSIIPWTLDVCKEATSNWQCTPYSSKEEKRLARITRRALRALRV